MMSEYTVLSFDNLFLNDTEINNLKGKIEHDMV